MAAVVNICVDPRLNHEVIRAQVAQKLERLGVVEQRIFITNDVGGNIGSAFRNTVTMLKERQQEEVVLVAAFDHDDCIAARSGMRRLPEANRQEMENVAAAAGLHCPMLTGSILTENSVVRWTDEPSGPASSFSMPAMPRMYG